jgi:hypothetical protein
MLEALITELEAIEDPRCGWKVEHRLIDILVIAVCAVLGEAESFEDIALYGRCKCDWLGSFLELPNGIPSHDTFRRMLMLVDPEAFERGFLGWARAVFRSDKDTSNEAWLKGCPASHLQRPDRFLDLGSAARYIAGMALFHAHIAQLRGLAIHPRGAVEANARHRGAILHHLLLQRAIKLHRHSEAGAPARPHGLLLHGHGLAGVHLGWHRLRGCRLAHLGHGRGSRLLGESHTRHDQGARHQKCDYRRAHEVNLHFAAVMQAAS